MSTLRTITDFKTALQGGGARPNLFEVDIPNIPAVADGIDWDADTFKFLCKAASLYPLPTLLQLMFLSEVEF